MKKFIEVSIVVIVLFLAALLLCGFGGSAVSSSDELLKPQDAKTKLAAKWIELYGTGSESVVHYNIALNRLMAQSIGEVVGNQGKYVAGLTDPNDPNSLVSKIAENERRASDIELSTSNNVTVLRMTQKTATAQIGEILNLLTELTKRVEELELEQSRTSKFENRIEALGGRIKKIEDTYMRYEPHEWPDVRVTDPNS